MTMSKESISASNSLVFRSFPLGRQAYALQTLGEGLVGIEDPLLQRKIAHAIELAEQARGLELAWRGHQRARGYGAEAQQLDYELDRALGALHAALSSTVDLHGAFSPRGLLAQRLIDRLFPRGVREVIHLPFHEEEHTVRVMLALAETEPELVEAVRELDLGPAFARVREVHARYRQALPPEPSQAVTWEQVQAARRAGHERLCEVVILVQGILFRGRVDAHHAAKLQAALREVFRQNEAIKRPYRRRRPVTELESETLEWVDEDGPELDLDEVDAA